MYSMRAYLDALQHVLNHGVDRDDRTGTGTRSIFGLQTRYNLEEGFPAITTKKLAFNAIKAELLWFLRGSQDVNDLRALGSKIWDANAEASYWKPHAEFDGDVGRIYGVQWRKWKTTNGEEIDQIANVIKKIKDLDQSYRRRLIVTAWHPGELDYDEQQPPKTALSPCHILFQFYVAEGTLSLQMYQRSGDMFLGVPFNIASYALLLSMIAQVTNLKPKDFIHVIGDAHIYRNHMNQVKEQLTRKPLPLPTLKLNPSVRDIDGFTMDDIKLESYQSHPAIKAPMAV